LVLLLLVAAGALGLPAGPARAAGTTTWTGLGADDSWNDPGNWDAGVPGPADTAVVRRLGGGPAFPELPAGLTVAGLVLGEGGNMHGGSIAVTGSLTWSGGSLQSLVELGATSTAVISTAVPGSAPVLQSPGGLVNRGVLVFVAGTHLHIVGSVIDNRGALRLADGSVLDNHVCCVSPTSTLLNSGTVDARPGLATLDALVLDNTGTILLESSATLALSLAPSALHPASQIKGSGRLLVQQRAALDLSGEITLAPAVTVELADALVTGSASLVGGTFAWTGGDIDADLTLASPTRLAVSGAAAKAIGDPGSLTSTGRATVTGTSTITLRGGGSSFTNAGTMTQSGAVTWSAAGCCASPATWRNSGTYINAVPAAATTLMDGIAVRNTGAVVLRSGRLATRLLGYLQTAGSTQLAGGSLVVPTGLVDLRAGQLTGHGSVTGAVRNAGTVSPHGTTTGAAGTMSITGSYVQTTSGTLLLDLFGPTVDRFDRLLASGRCTRGGTLQVSLGAGFSPSSGSFVVLTGSPTNGSFATVQLPSATWRLTTTTGRTVVRR